MLNIFLYIRHDERLDPSAVFPPPPLYIRTHMAPDSTESRLAHCIQSVLIMDALLNSHAHNKMHYL